MLILCCICGSAGTGTAPAGGVHSAVISADVSEPKEADTTIVSVVNSWPTMSLREIPKLY